METEKDIKHNHRFLDEAGDTAFYGRGKTSILGNAGVSNCFIIGMVKFKESLPEIRSAVAELQIRISVDPYFDVILLDSEVLTFCQ